MRTAQDIMNTDILTVHDDMPLSDLAVFLVENEISGAPVLDATGHLLGVVSVTDIARCQGEHLAVRAESEPADFFIRDYNQVADTLGLHTINIADSGELTARDIMTPTVFTVPEQTPVDQIAKTMFAGRIHRILVTRNNRVVGIISSLDMLKLLFEPAPVATDKRPHTPPARWSP